MSYALRYYQQEAVDAVWASLYAKRGNPLIDLPTGAGKSLVVADVCKTVVEKWTGQCVVLAHRKELLVQNTAKIQSLTLTPVGIYSAGLNKRNTDRPILVAGIQSIFNKAAEIGRRHVVVIDEAHLLGKTDGTMYRTFLDELGAINPGLVVIGLTATPYRLDSGALWGDGELFSHVAYRGDIRKMIAEGFLCDLINEPSQTAYDTSHLHIRGGEFVQREVEDLYANQDLLDNAVKELVNFSADRNSIIVFCTGVAHAEQVTERIAMLTGQRVDCVHGETPKLMRAASLEAFTRGVVRWLVNVDVLTTGFDAQRIDCVAIMRCTMSAGLFCQMVGRGLRTHPVKRNCLILDFGGNLDRHGPIDAIDFGKRQSKSGGDSQAPTKHCPGCGLKQPAGTRNCECGFRFPEPEVSHNDQADTHSRVLSEPEIFTVEGIHYSRHTGKSGKLDTLRVDYHCVRDEDGADFEERISEWVCTEHPLGWAKNKADQWWAKRSLSAPPCSIDAALSLAERGALADTRRLKVQRRGKLWDILGYDFGEKPETWLRVADVPQHQNGWEEFADETGSLPF